MPNVDSDIRDKLTQCFHNGDGNYTTTTREAATTREWSNLGGGTIGDKKR